MLSRINVADRYKRLPNHKSAVLFRLGVDDQLIATKPVEYVQYRPQGRGETATSSGPLATQNAEINFWVSELGVWKIEENDIVFIDGKWWFVSSVTLEMMDSRYRCQCLPSSEVA